MPESDVTLEIVEETAITIELVETGARGVGVPAGGTTGQVLKKTSNADYAADWEDEQGGGGGGAVDSVFGRTGAVVAEAGDYNEAQIAIEDAQVYEDLTAGSVTGTTVKELLVSLITGFSATITSILTFITTKAFDKSADDLDDITAGTTNKHFTQTEKTKLSGIEAGAEVNNISDANATDLTDAGDSTLHHHAADRSRANHTGEQAISTVTGLQTALDGKAAAANAKGVIVHGATAGTARPTGYASIEWIGSVEPTNATNDDTWIDTSS